MEPTYPAVPSSLLHQEETASLWDLIKTLPIKWNSLELALAVVLKKEEATVAGARDHCSRLGGHLRLGSAQQRLNRSLMACVVTCEHWK